MYCNENDIFQDVQGPHDLIEIRNTIVTENNDVYISHDIILENGNLDLIIESIIDEFTLNVKQTVAFRLIIDQML